jgi:hypothetical protein
MCVAFAAAATSEPLAVDDSAACLKWPNDARFRTADKVVPQTPEWCVSDGTHDRGYVSDQLRSVDGFVDDQVLFLVAARFCTWPMFCRLIRS